MDVVKREFIKQKLVKICDMVYEYQFQNYTPYCELDGELFDLEQFVGTMVYDDKYYEVIYIRKNYYDNKENLNVLKREVAMFEFWDSKETEITKIKGRWD